MKRIEGIVLVAVYEGNFIFWSVLYLITCCVNSTTRLTGVKGFISGTCSPPFKGHVEISYFNVHGINFCLYCCNWGFTVRLRDFLTMFNKPFSYYIIFYYVWEEWRCWQVQGLTPLDQWQQTQNLLTVVASSLRRKVQIEM